MRFKVRYLAFHPDSGYIFLYKRFDYSGNVTNAVKIRGLHRYQPKSYIKNTKGSLNEPYCILFTLFLVAVFSQAFFPFMCRHLRPFPFFTTWHKLPLHFYVPGCMSFISLIYCCTLIASTVFGCAFISCSHFTTALL